MNSKAAVEKKANRVTSSAKPKSCPRLKNWSGKCGSMKKQRLPWTKVNQTVQWTDPLYQGYPQVMVGGREPIDLVVAHAVVVGRMISTAWPRFSSARLRPKMTSPNPPACATGAHSEATILPRTRFSPYRPVETGALLEADGYATLCGKHGARTIRVGRRTWEVLQQLAADKELDDRIVAIDDIVAITDERIQILTAGRRGAERRSSCPTGFVTRMARMRISAAPRRPRFATRSAMLH